MPECVAGKRFVRGGAPIREVSDAYASFSRVRRPWVGAPLPGLDIGVVVAMVVAGALLLAALFAGDSFWTAAVVLLAAGAWSALALRRMGPGTGRPAAARPCCSRRRRGAASRSCGRSLPIAPGTSSTARSCSRGSSPSACCSGPSAAERAGAPRPARSWRSARPSSGRSRARWCRRSSRTGRAQPACATRSATGTRSRSRRTRCSCSDRGPPFRARNRVTRVAGTVLAYAAVVAMFLSVSRTGLAAAVAGVALWLWLARERLSAAALAVAAVLPACRRRGLGVHASRARRIRTGARRPRSRTAPRWASSSWWARWSPRCAVELIAQRDSPRLRRRVPAGRPGRARRRRWSPAWARSRSVRARARVRARPDSSTRPRTTGSSWWGEALRILRAKPLGGAGADTFKVARKRYREEAVETVEPHDVPLQVLAGTGPVGLLLFVSFLAAAAWAAAAALRRLEGAERAAAAALAVFPALWLFHALVDFPWNFVAVTGPALFARRRARRCGPRARARAQSLRRGRGRSPCRVAAVASAAIPVARGAERA